MLQRESRLVGEPPDDGERRRVRFGDDDLPGHRDDELGLTGDDDRRSQGRAHAQPTDELEAVTPAALEDVGHERGAQTSDRVAELREVVERQLELGLELGPGRVYAQELERVRIDPPDQAEVGTEGDASLATDGDQHAACVVDEEAWGDLQDAVECLTGLVLGLVETCTFEGLPGEIGDDPRKALGLRRRPAFTIEQEPDRPYDVTAARAKRNGEGASNGRRKHVPAVRIARVDDLTGRRTSKPSFTRGLRDRR